MKDIDDSWFVQPSTADQMRDYYRLQIPAEVETNLGKDTCAPLQALQALLSSRRFFAPRLSFTNLVKEENEVRQFYILKETEDGNPLPQRHMHMLDLEEPLRICKSPEPLMELHAQTHGSERCAARLAQTHEGVEEG